MTQPHDRPRTVGELKASGHRERGVKAEIRENLLAALADGRDAWPGILGFEDTVIPQLERALIAGHDVVLLGERGQGKTRLLRALTGLLDEWTPVIDGAERPQMPAFDGVSCTDTIVPSPQLARGPMRVGPRAGSRQQS